jgi:hypothetical protein
MRTVRVAIIGFLLLGAAHAAAAQQIQAISVNKLPIDLDKVQHGLRQAAASDSSDNHGLKINYRVDVYGEAPRIEIFTKDDNLATMPAPYGAPTHRDMMQSVTRTFDGRGASYRSPELMDFSSLLRWFSDKANRK